MKIPIDRLDFKDEGYTTEAGEPLWLELPRSVREGYVYDIISLQKTLSDDADEASAEDARRLVIAALSLVERWNFDDQDGNPLKPLKDCKTPEEEATVVKEIPMEVVNKIVDKATNTEGDKSTD